MMKRWLFVFLLLLPAVALADPADLALAIVAAFSVEYATAYIIATLIINFAISIAIRFVASAFAPSQSGGYTASALADRTHVIRSTVQTRNISYGEIATSGPLVFAASSDKGADKNKYLHLVIALAAHEVDAITDIWLNDNLILNGEIDGDAFVQNGKYLLYENADHVQTFPSFVAGNTLTLLSRADVVNTVTQQTTGYFSVDQGDGGSVQAYGTYDNPISWVLNTDGTVRPLTSSDGPITIYYHTASYRPLVRVKKHLGSPTQMADSDLMAECPALWTSAHRLQGIAYLYVRLEYDVGIFVTGVPNVRALVRGKKVYDPRTGLTAYSTNYALCVNDYMTSPDGLNCSASDIDRATLIASANHCDELVTVSGGTEPRYSMNGMVQLDHTPDETLRQMSTAAGGIMPALAGGVFYIFVGVYDTPTVTLTESDLRDKVKVSPRAARATLFNSVTGTYVDGDGGTWQPTSYPPVTNADYVTADNGEAIAKEVQLPFTTSIWSAQRLAKVVLDRARRATVIEFPCKVTGFQLRVWDTVYVSLTKFGWTNKVFRVISWTFNSNSGVDLILLEEDPSSYAWNYGQATPLNVGVQTTLPDASTVEALSPVTCFAGTNELLVQKDGSITSRMHVMWPAAQSQISYAGGKVEVQYRKVTDSTWHSWQPLPGDAIDTFISPVDDQSTYQVRVRLVSSRAVPGAWTYSSPAYILGKMQPPPDVTSFSVDADGVASWTGVAAVDLAGYLIRWQPGNNRSWGDATPLHDGILTASPYNVHIRPNSIATFMIKAIDTSGNASVNVAASVVNLGDPLVANVIATTDYAATGFPGVYSGASVSGSSLLATPDASPIAWDADPNTAGWTLDTDPGWTVATYGPVVYTPDVLIVATADEGSQLTLQSAIAGTAYLIEFRRDGDAAGWTSDAEPGWTNDADLSWLTENWRPWPGSLTSRAGRYEWRISIQSRDVQGIISAFAALLDVTDQLEVVGQVAILAAGTIIPSAKTWRAIKNINMTLVADGGMARTARIEDKTARRVSARDISDVAVNGTVLATIQGY
jgi:hypothetical protein